MNYVRIIYIKDYKNYANNIFNIDDKLMYNLNFFRITTNLKNEDVIVDLYSSLIMTYNMKVINAKRKFVLSLYLILV